MFSEILVGVIVTFITVPVTLWISGMIEKKRKPIIKVRPNLSPFEYVNVDSGRIRPKEVSEGGERGLFGTRIEKATYYFLELSCEGNNKVLTSLPIIFLKDDGEFIPFGVTFWNAHTEEEVVIDPGTEGAYFCVFMVDDDSCTFRMWDPSSGSWKKREDTELQLKIKPEALDAKHESLFLTVELDCSNEGSQVNLKDYNTNLG